jgi:predicted ATPase
VARRDRVPDHHHRPAGCRQLEAFPEGVYHVDLSAAEQPHLLEPTIARELGVHELGDAPLSLSLRQFLAQRKVLLVLDAFDRVLPAKDVVAELMQACPDVSVLVTCSNRLNLRGEKVVELKPLPVPDVDRLPALEELRLNPAVRLFVEVAQTKLADFALTAENAAAVAGICARVDGLPAAIELLASQIALRTPEEMLEEPMVTTGRLAETIRFATELLEPPVLALFARLGVFVGGFTRQAAEQVVGPQLDINVLDGLQSLLDRSLLQVRMVNGRYRFFLIGPIREHAVRLLCDSGDQMEVWRRHALWYRESLEHAEPGLEGEDQVACLAAWTPEQENVRAVLERCAHGAVDVEEGLRLASAVGPLWYVRGQFGEGRQWLQRLLAVGLTVRLPVRAKSLNWAGILAYHQNDLAEAEQLLEEGLAAFRASTTDDPATVRLLRELNFVHPDEGVAKSLNGLGFVAKEQGHLDQAVTHYEESLRLYRSLNHEWGIVWTATDLALVQLLRDDVTAAITLLEESLDRQEARPVRGLSGKALTQIYYAAARAAQGDREDARHRADAAQEDCRRIGYRRGGGLAAHLSGVLYLAAGQPGSADERFRECLTVWRDLGDRQGMVACLESLAASAERLGDHARAVRLLGPTERLWAGVGRRRAPVWPSAVQRVLDEALQDLRAEVAAGPASGRTPSLQDAVEDALAGN